MPSVTPSKTPERISTRSSSWRGVVSELWPGRRRSRSRWISAASSGSRGGQPSTTTPTPPPWLSPKVVIWKVCPKRLDTRRRYTRLRIAPPPRSAPRERLARGAAQRQRRERGSRHPAVCVPAGRAGRAPRPARARYTCRRSSRCVKACSIAPSGSGARDAEPDPFAQRARERAGGRLAVARARRRAAPRVRRAGRAAAAAPPTRGRVARARPPPPRRAAPAPARDLHGQRLRAPLRARGAVRRPRAGRAARRARRAHHRAELHQRLVQRAGILAARELLGLAPEPLLHCAAAHVGVDPEQAREHARHVAVDDRRRACRTRSKRARPPCSARRRAARAARRRRRAAGPRGAPPPAARRGAGCARASSSRGRPTARSRRRHRRSRALRTSGKRARKRSQYGITVSTRVCWSIASEIQIAYGSRVRRHGRSRRWARYHASSFLRSAPRRRGVTCARRLRIQVRLDVIGDPFRVPPLDRIDVGVADQRREVQVVAAGEAGRAGEAEPLAALDARARLDVDARQVAVERGEPEAVVEHDAVAVDPEIAREEHPARGRRGDRRRRRATRGRSRSARRARSRARPPRRCASRRSGSSPSSWRAGAGCR